MVDLNEVQRPESHMALKRLLAFSLALVLAVVTYCAQSCFEMEFSKPICPEHHTSDCCKHESPTSGIWQRIAAYLPDATRLLPSNAPDSLYTSGVLSDWCTDVGFIVKRTRDLPESLSLDQSAVLRI